MSALSVTALTRISLATAITLALVACNKPQQAATPPTPATPPAVPVATVDGKVISKAEYDFYVKQVTQGKGPVQLTPEQRTQVIDELVGMQILAAQGARDNVDSDPEVAARLDVTRMHLLADAESQKYLKTRQPSDQDLHDEYNNAIASLDKNEYHVHHILVETREAAEQLIKKLKGGAKFEDVAKAQSKDSGSKPSGGDLGWFALGRMVKPFGDAVKALKKGEITAVPVETKFGWHIIRLDDTREVAPPPFDQVKEQVLNRVIQKRLQAYVDDLKKTAKIEIAPAPAPAPAAAQPAAPAASAASSAASQ
jgi:peptidyl-prolyl cis-trans isomerase C